MTKPPRRRQYGTGSLTELPSGKWRGSFEAGYTRTGARRRLSVIGATEAEVKRKLTAKRRDYEQHGAAPNRRVTVKAWADEWLTDQSRRLRPKTVSAYRGSAAWIVSTIGAKRLADLTPADVRAVANAQRKAGRSSTTALHTHSVLTRMLRAALVDGHPVPERVLYVERPRKAVHDREGLDIDQALAVLEAAYQLPHFSRYAAALFLGLRRGEALGLTWDQVDLETGQVVVSWQLQDLPYRIPRDRSSGFLIPDGFDVRRLHGAAHLVRPKSRAGWRVLPLVGPLRAMFADWRARAPVSPHGLVWPQENGQPRDVKKDLAEWKALQGTAGVTHPAGRSYVLHEARNTTATLLLEAGADVKVITAILGHASIVTSRGYMHVSTEQSRKALDLVAGRLTAGR